jgi:hypothetical protein
MQKILALALKRVQVKGRKTEFMILVSLGAAGVRPLGQSLVPGVIPSTRSDQSPFGARTRTAGRIFLVFS